MYIADSLARLGQPAAARGEHAEADRLWDEALTTGSVEHRALIHAWRGESKALDALLEQHGDELQPFTLLEVLARSGDARPVLDRILELAPPDRREAMVRDIPMMGSI